MSGGVDSSVAAYLLKEQGYEVIGLFMSLGTCLEKLAPKRKACCSIYDARDASQVAEVIGIKFSILDFKNEFENLIAYFCYEYDKGRTPNPCIRCNQYLKFGKLLESADKLGADFIATGHYARVVHKRGQVILKKGSDKVKDQSYVLFPLTQTQLSRVIFPLGEMRKEDVRQIAREINLPIKDKLESQEICFVPGSGYHTLLKERIPERLKKGPVIDTTGKVVGEHQGYQLFTIGQRHGLKIALGKPAYVVKIIPETNTIILGSKENLYKTTFLVDEVNWISLFDNAIKPTKTLVARGNPDELLQTRLRQEADVKIRYLHKPARAKIDVIDDNLIQGRFYQPQLAITPGQASVFYRGDTVLGGGWIKEVR